MIIGDEIDYVELKRLPETDEGGPGDFRINVHVKLRDFQGWYDQVWIRKHEMDAFVEGLDRFGETRFCNVKLHGSNPGEFILRFYTLNEDGHVGVDVHLARIHAAPSENFNINLTGGFQLDTEKLPSLRAAFDELYHPA